MVGPPVTGVAVPRRAATTHEGRTGPLKRTVSRLKGCGHAVPLEGIRYP